MKYISIDLETTGLSSETCEVIEFGAVLDDLTTLQPIESLPKFHTYILPKDGMYRGEPYALSMHPEKFRRIADRDRDYTYTSAGKLGFKFKEFLVANGYEMKNDYVTINVAGKNFASFDLPFLRKIEGFCKHVNIRHRIIDPSILYWESGDEKLPDTETCKKRAGIDGIVAHNSIDDCLDVVKLLRYSFNKE